MDQPIQERIDKLRAWLLENELDAFIIPHDDEYLGEYLPAHNERLQWATGFTGSAGAAIVTREKAAIFVDGRYTVQVRNQVPADLFEYRHLIDEPITDWLNQHSSIKKLAVDPKMHSAKWFDATLEKLEELSVHTITQNPIDILWKDRPSPIISTIRLMDINLAGEASSEKRDAVAAILKDRKLDAAVLTELDTICWLLNIRGLDVARLPVILSHAIIYSSGELDFFISSDRITSDFHAHVGNGVSVISPNELSSRIHSLAGKKVSFDPSVSNAWFKLEMQKANVDIIESADPCLLLKAAKNPTEVKGMKSCHIKDGVAMVKFLCWFDAEVESGSLHDEAKLADKLQSFREQDESLVDLSFDTISAAGANAAMCHYNHSDQENPSQLEMNSLYLVDSGGQYLNGTTDITRTIAVGTPTDEMKQQFTLVLKGHISLATARFPKGTTGSQLDILARQHLWAKGFDYDHGTGHGVGHFLSVHEGPQRISKAPSTVSLLAGMVLSNEPGYYRADNFGIRIENLELVVEKEAGGDFSVLGFEALTLCPIDTRNIKIELLDEREIHWLNSYHQKVWDSLSPLLEGDTRDWLKKATLAI